MHPVLRRSIPRGVIVALLALVPLAEAPAFSTGVPVQFSIDPASIRQRDKDEGSAVATVILKAPSPTFFVCQIRSSDREKISFTNIVFRKGQIQGTAPGTVYWLRILKDSNVKISAFSVDDPGEKLWFTVSLKIKDEDQPANGQEP